MGRVLAMIVMVVLADVGSGLSLTGMHNQKKKKRLVPPLRAESKTVNREPRKKEVPFGAVMVGASAVACIFPAQTSAVLPASKLGSALGLAMFGAACGLKVSDVTRALAKRPKVLLGGVAAQFAVMPTLAWLCSHLNADPLLRQGVILVGCCPGGAASNVVALLAKADVALSVAMTACSTMAAGVMTPLLFRALSGEVTTLDPSLLYTPLLKSLVLPTSLGVLFNEMAPSALKKRVQNVAPALSSFLIAAIVAKVLADVRLQAVGTGLGVFASLFTSLICLHSGGFLAGYLLSRFLIKTPPPQARAISIEVGMQNSALSVVLATSSGTAPPLAGLPGAVSASVHSLIGAALATYWRSSSQSSSSSKNDSSM